MITATAVHPPPAGEALRTPQAAPVPQRLLLRPETYAQLERLAKALAETRGLSLDPAEVAVIALEAGLEQVQASLRRAPARTPRRRPGRSRLKLDEAERTELERWLAAQHSVRSRQRTIALWLGRRRRRIAVEALRELAATYAAYDVANFAQNMKKDGAFFEELRDGQGRRTGWRLSRLGRAEARALEELSS
ncbi:MAG: hypothetical protein D6731_21400 [Planctomycetota bacterium]|nr:MAG: hypothetical protein D6731_21400 [Planctomycetota bacterium]